MDNTNHRKPVITDNLYQAIKNNNKDELISNLCEIRKKYDDAIKKLQTAGEIYKTNKDKEKQLAKRSDIGQARKNEVLLGKEITKNFKDLRNDKNYSLLDDDSLRVIAEKRSSDSLPALYKKSMASSFSKFESLLTKNGFPQIATNIYKSKMDQIKNNHLDGITKPSPGSAEKIQEPQDIDNHMADILSGYNKFRKHAAFADKSKVKDFNSRYLMELDTDYTILYTCARKFAILAGKKVFLRTN